MRAATATGASRLAAGDGVYRFTVEQYHRLIEGQVFLPGDRVELLEGLIVRKMTHNPPHDATVSLVEDALRPLLPEGWMLRIQSSVTTTDSEPEPDVAVVLGPARRYAQSHPLPRDIGFLVEVADSSLEEDRGPKARTYAKARIPVYWIVNIPERCVGVYTNPRAGRSPAYRARQDYREGDVVPVGGDSGSASGTGRGKRPPLVSVEDQRRHRDECCGRMGATSEVARR